MRKKHLSLRLKFSLIIMLMCMLLSALIVALGYQTYSSQIFQRYETETIALQDNVSELIDWDRVPHYLETLETDDEYWDTLDSMRQSKDAADATYVFVFYPDADEMVFIFDTDESDEQYMLGDRSPLEREFGDLMGDEMNLETIGPAFFSSYYGSLISTYKPFYTSTGEFAGFLGIDFEVDNFRAEEREFVIKLASISFLIAIIMTIVFVLILRRLVIKPVNIIADAANSYISDKENTIARKNSITELNITTKDELQDLADSIKSMENKIQDYFVNLQESNYRAETDLMTEIYNRKAFDSRVEWAIENDEYKGHSVFMLIDLDYFKEVNDTFGHSVGDEVIVAAAQALKSCSRSSDYVSRFGGDEFAVFFRSPSSLGIVESRTAALLDAIRSIDVHDEIKVTASIGVAAFSTSKVATYDELYEAADKALYEAKEAGRNRFVINFISEYEKTDLFDK